jgi:hypothetical protein
MFKQTLVSLALASIFGAGVAFAADAVKVEPGTGPTDAVSKQVPEMKPAAGAADTKKQDPAANSNAAAASPASCTEAELTGLIAKAGALTDKEKQKMAMGHLELAKKSLNAKDMDSCARHMKEASNNLGIVTK